MKKWIFVILAIIAVTPNLQAGNIYLELGGSLNTVSNIADREKADPLKDRSVSMVPGGSLMFGFELLPGIIPLIYADSGMVTTKTLNSPTWDTITNTADTVNTDDVSEYLRHYMGGVGLQYRFQIMKLPLFWSSMVVIGASRTEWNVSDYYKGGKEAGLLHSKSDIGPVFIATTGVHYNLNQWLSPFIQVGYYKSFYSVDFAKSSIGGISINVGFSFTIHGRNKDLFQGY